MNICINKEERVNIWCHQGNQPISQTIHRLKIEIFVKKNLTNFYSNDTITGHKFAHATRAELPWHVQNSDLIWSLFSMQE